MESVQSKLAEALKSSSLSADVKDALSKTFDNAIEKSNAELKKLKLAG